MVDEWWVRAYLTRAMMVRKKVRMVKGMVNIMVCVGNKKSPRWKVSVFYFIFSCLGICEEAAASIAVMVVGEWKAL